MCIREVYVKLRFVMNNVVKMERPASAANVALILIDNPPVNAIGRDVYDGLLAMMESVERDTSVQAVVIAAEGRTFIAGADIKLLEAAARGEAIRLYLRPLLDKIELSPKPVVVALHGTALGGGMELAMAAHYRVAAPDAQMGQPEVNLGIIPGGGGTQRLTRLVGEGKAMEMILGGEIISADTALAIGLVNHVVPADQLETKTMEIANRMAEKSPVALRLAKESVKLASRSNLDEGLRREVDLFALCFSTEDKNEGVSAFLEKRKPAFTGK